MKGGSFVVLVLTLLQKLNGIIHIHRWGLLFMLQTELTPYYVHTKMRREIRKSHMHKNTVLGI